VLVADSLAVAVIMVSVELVEPNDVAELSELMYEVGSLLEVESVSEFVVEVIEE